MADFIWVPDSVTKKEINYNTLITQFENMVEQRRPVTTENIAIFSLSFTNRAKATTDAIVAFFELKYGNVTSFTFEPPDESVEYDVRFSDPRLAPTRKAYNVYDLPITLVQVL